MYVMRRTADCDSPAAMSVRGRKPPKIVVASWRTALPACEKMSYEKLSPGCESDEYSAGSADFAASTPTCWAETPTQAKPSRISSLWESVQSGLSSVPPLTLSHSTTTVPLNFLGFLGR